MISFADQISFVFLDDFFDLDPQQITSRRSQQKYTIKTMKFEAKLVFYFWFDFFLRNNYSDAGRFVKVVHVDVWLWMRQQILHRTCCKLRTFYIYIVIFSQTNFWWFNSLITIKLELGSYPVLHDLVYDERLVVVDRRFKPSGQMVQQHSCLFGQRFIVCLRLK